MEFIFKITLVLLLVLLNGYFVASEFALVSMRRTRVNELVKKGNRRAKLLKGAHDNLDHYISSTQLGITIASLALGWIGEPAIAHFLEPFLSFLPETAAVITSHSLSVIIAFTLITFLHIVLGELAPKTIALQKPEATALFIITPLALFTRVFKPFIWLLNGAGQIVIRALGFKASHDEQLFHSEDEIKMLLRQSSQVGAIPSKEVEMMQNVLQLGDIPVKLVMVPRTEVLAFSVSTPLREVVEKIHTHPHSRFPVFENSVDTIVGFIHVKDIYKEMVKKKDNVKIAQLGIIRDTISVPEMKKIDTVLQDMRRKQIHLGVVNDEFGGTAGIVTLEDILEVLVGEIRDEFDTPTSSISRQKDGTYLVDGHTLISDVQEKFKLPIKGQGYITIGGLVFGLLGHEPEKGDSVEVGDLQLRVLKLQGKRIKMLELRRTTRKSPKK